MSNKSSTSGEGLIPSPDPTALTTAALLREIATTKEIISTRIDAMDKAIDLLQKFADKQPTTMTVSQQVIALDQLLQEKFRSIEKQFIERDSRTEQTSRDSKVAVDAALQAAKEAVAEQNRSNALAIAKSEATFTKQIDQLGTLINAMEKGFDGKINDIKDRITSSDGRFISSEGQKKGSHEGIGLIGSIVIGAVAVIGVAISAVALVNSLMQ